MPITLSGAGTVAANAPIGTLIGTLSATEPDGTPVACVFYIARPSVFFVRNGNELVTAVSPIPAFDVGANQVGISTAPEPPAPAYGAVKVTVT